MTGLVLLAVVIAAAGLWLWTRQRADQSIESGITSFRREMQALAPPDGRRVEPEQLNPVPEPRIGGGPTPADEPPPADEAPLDWDDDERSSDAEGMTDGS